MTFLTTEDLIGKEVWLKLSHTKDADPDKKWVPAYYFRICLNESGEEVGCCDLRIGCNENTYYGGQIGYTVLEPYRGNHYAQKACELLFRQACKHGMREITIAVNPANEPSRKVCENLGGVLAGIVPLPEWTDRYQEGERITCIYRVALPEKECYNNA